MATNLATQTNSKSTSPVLAGGNSFDYEAKIAAMTPKEKEDALALTSKISVNDLSTVQTYGSELSRVISQNGEVLLQSVRSDNTSEVVGLTNELLSQLNMIDIDELNTNNRFRNFARRIPILRNIVTSVQNVMVKYDTISDNVEKISKKISSSKIVAMRDNSTLQQIFDNNVSYINEMRQLIIGAKLKEQELAHQIEQMQEDPNVEPYQIQDMQTLQTSVQKRIADMQTSEYVLTQNLFQIRATQSNNMAIADKAENIVNNVIPIWKNQLAISIIMNNQTASIDAQKKITETTNEILKKNAANLKTNSINVAKANEQQVISLDTLRDTTAKLIETVTEVKRIHDEGNKNRQAIESSLKEYSEQLMNAINQ